MMRCQPHSLFALLALVFLSHGASAQSHKHEKKVTQVAQPRQHAKSDTVGVVNGEVITYGDFNSIMSGYLKIFVKRSHDNVITDSLYTVIVDSSWDRAVNDILTEQEIHKRNLSMTEAQIKAAILENPPPYLRTQFVDSAGTFHHEYLTQALDDPRNDSIVQTILAGEQVRLETEQLWKSIDPSATTESALARSYQAWLRKSRMTAKIVDKRTQFGFY
jgi:hypothetical protein